MWSLIITVFGDCVSLRGGTIAMAELQAITSLLKIEPGALRTAMSRLAKENWLEREKVGRNSFYKISNKGLDSFTEPTLKIYGGNKIDSSKEFLLGIKEVSNGREQKAFIKFVSRTNSIAINRHVFFIPKKASNDRYIREEKIFIVEGFEKNTPDWLNELLFPQQLRSNLKGFINKFEELDRNMSLKDLSSEDALIIRILLVHQWRRIILKIHHNPLMQSPKDWLLEDCRSLVASIYRRVSLRSEDWWDLPLSRKQADILLSRFTLLK